MAANPTESQPRPQSPPALRQEAQEIEAAAINAREQGMAEKAAEFLERGAEIYVEAGE